MVLVGAVLVLVFALIALGVAGLTLWSGWTAFRDELQPGFKTVPPGPRSISLTVLGVVVPVLAIVIFTLYLAVELVRLAIAAL